MAGPFPESSIPEAPGLIAGATAFLAAKLAYLRARCELAGVEGKEALINYAIILALAIGAIVVVIFGYLFLVIALVFLIALAFTHESAWIWVMLGAGLLHVLLAAAFLFIAKTRLSRPMFDATLHEFRKDQEWLTTLGKRN